MRREIAKVCLKMESRHCERSEAIHSFFARRDGLLRSARNDGFNTPTLLFEIGIENFHGRRCAPSPLVGEGWGEGARSIDSP